jgi:hypothetical protein
MTDWISVEDQLPEDSLDVYVVGKFAQEFMSAPGNYNQRPAEVVSGKYVRNFKRIYTHWMPLPEPLSEAE